MRKILAQFLAIEAEVVVNVVTLTPRGIEHRLNPEGTACANDCDACQYVTLEGLRRLSSDEALDKLRTIRRSQKFEGEK